MITAAANCLDLETTSSFLGFAPQHIFYMVENSDDLYTTIEIPKKSNPAQTRPIDIPYSELKGIQREIDRKILKPEPSSEYTHSYVSGRSIITAATELSGQKAVLKLDIQNFFPSISRKRVYGLYKSRGFTSSGAYLLTCLTTKHDCIAQGAPTSPNISNLVVRNMDQRLADLARSWDLNYLRYSDDMFFYKDKNFNHPRLSDISEQIVERSGFSLNQQKTRYYPKGKPRITLGLLTHGKRPRIPGPQRKTHRAAFFKASRDPDWGHRNRERLKGMLEWHKAVNGRDDDYWRYRAAVDNIEKVYLHKAYRSGLR